ncbi:MAG: ABC transporter permease, partial [Bacteroidota bacterium]|nr:ABC transporter permease [Bacteroidota bacterium]
MGLFFKLGQYYLLMAKVFSKPEKKMLFFKQTIKEIEKIGLNSISIVLIISVFIGGVITLQMAYNIENPLFPSYTISLSTRDTILLE